MIVKLPSGRFVNLANMTESRHTTSDTGHPGTRI